MVPPTGGTTREVGADTRRLSAARRHPRCCLSPRIPRQARAIGPTGPEHSTPGFIGRDARCIARVLFLKVGDGSPLATHVLGLGRFSD